MKQIIILFLVLISFCSCNKLELDAPQQEEITMELDVQSIDASAIILINDSVYYLDCINQHKVTRYVDNRIKTFSIIKTSSRGKITATFRDRINKKYYELGEIVSQKSYSNKY